LSVKCEINGKILAVKTLLNIEKEFSGIEDSIHKVRNELKVLELEGIKTVVKSFKVPHFLNRIVYSFFRDSKAKKSYQYALKIGNFTPKPLAYIEFYENFLLKESYFISENFEYDFTIREPLLEKDFADRENIFRAFTRFTLELHNAKIFHNDYSPGNILIKKRKGEYVFKIVDINRMKFIKLSENLRAKNFSKLWADDDVLKIIGDEYAKHHNVSTSFMQKLLDYNNNNKRIKNFKKRLKGKKV